MALCCRTQTHTLHTPLRLTLLPLTLVFQVPAGNASANDGAANPAPSSDGRCVLQDSRPSLCVNCRVCCSLRPSLRVDCRCVL